MHRVNADQADTDFDNWIEMVQSDPVEVIRNGESVAVMLSMTALKDLIGIKRSAPRPELETLMRDSVTRCGKV